jgi:hypothetical protein
VIERLLRESVVHTSGTPALLGAMPRTGSPLPGSSTLMTSAPKSASKLAPNAPENIVAMSRTRTPTSGPRVAASASSRASGITSLLS